MNVIDYNKVESHPNPHGVDVRKLIANPKYNVIVGMLKPGEVIEKHSTDVDAIFYVLEGKGILMLGNEEREVTADMVIECPAHVEKGWRNESDSALRFLAVKFG